jgi:hypothetical protein
MTRYRPDYARLEVDADRCARLSREFLDCVSVGYGLLNVRTHNGEPVDARFIDLSAALERWPPLKGARGLWVRQVLPGLDEKVFMMLRTAHVTGEAGELELRLALTGGRPVRISACRLGHPKERLVGVLVQETRARASSESGGPW